MNVSLNRYSVNINTLNTNTKYIPLVLFQTFLSLSNKACKLKRMVNVQSNLLVCNIQWNLYKATTKFCGLSRQVLFHDSENKYDFVKSVPGKRWNLCVFSKTFEVSLYRFHCISWRVFREFYSKSCRDVRRRSINLKLAAWCLNQG